MTQTKKSRKLAKRLPESYIWKIKPQIYRLFTKFFLTSKLKVHFLLHSLRFLAVGWELSLHVSFLVLCWEGYEAVCHPARSNKLWFIVYFASLRWTIPLKEELKRSSPTETVSSAEFTPPCWGSSDWFGRTGFFISSLFFVRCLHCGGRSSGTCVVGLRALVTLTVHVVSSLDLTFC